jgi:hypothetical protein
MVKEPVARDNEIVAAEVSLRQGDGGRSSVRFALQAKAGAGDETRTRDVLLGKEVLYH